jgi:hypothetical protein
MSLNAAAFNLLVGTSDGSGKRTNAPPKRSGKQTAKTGDGAEALIEFLYDKTEQVVGLRLASPTSLNSYPVRRQPESESYLVTAKAFLAYHGIGTDKLRRFVARLYEGKIVGFSLKEDELK